MNLLHLIMLQLLLLPKTSKLLLIWLEPAQYIILMAPTLLHQLSWNNILTSMKMILSLPFLTAQLINKHFKILLLKQKESQQMKLLKCRKILLMLRQITTMLRISLPKSHGKKLLKPIKTFLRLLVNIKKLSMNYISLLLFWLQVEIQQSKPMNTKSKRQCMMYKLKN